MLLLYGQPRSFPAEPRGKTSASVTTSELYNTPSSEFGMTLDPVIQGEVSQKEKHQYRILTHIYGIQKDGNDDPICETAKETQR